MILYANAHSSGRESLGGFGQTSGYFAISHKRNSQTLHMGDWWNEDIPVLEAGARNSVRVRVSHPPPKI